MVDHTPSATPATRNDGDVVKCHACHAKRRWPSAPPEPAQCHKCHARPGKVQVDVAKMVCERWCVTKLCVKRWCVTKLCVKESVCDKVVWKMVCDKVMCVRWYVTKLCVKDVWKMCERWCVCVCGTKLCVKHGVWQSYVKESVWQSCVRKMVCDKVVCERWCVTKLRRRRRRRRRRRTGRIQNQKQEPHTKMWGKTQGFDFVLRLPPQHPCMQVSRSDYIAFCSITSLTCMSRRTWQQDVTAIMQPLHCDLRSEIQQAHRTTHTWANTRCRTQRRNRFDDETTAAATAAHTRYLSSPPAATLHGKTQGFVLRLPPQQAPCNSHAAIRNSEDCFPTSFEYWISLPCLRLNFRFHQNFIGCPCLASARRRFPTVGAAQTPRWCDGYQSRCQTSQPRGMLMMLDIPWDLIF